MEIYESKLKILNMELEIKKKKEEENIKAYESECFFNNEKEEFDYCLQHPENSKKNFFRKKEFIINSDFPKKKMKFYDDK